MANPIKMRKSGGLYDNGVIVMSSAEMDYACSVILLKVASETNGNVGDIYIDGTGTSIGTFDDKFANGALSSHPADVTEYSTSNTFQQNTASASEASVITPAGFAANGQGASPQGNTDLNGGLIQRCLDKIALANSTYAETGTYYLSNTAPSISGTWVVEDSVVDTVTNNIADAGLDVTYNLYRKTSHDTSPTEELPLKTVANGLQEMSVADIQSLSARLRNRIIATGIGTYVLQTSAPVSGTWISRGSIVDRMPTITSEQYSRTFTGQYTSQYTRLFTSQYAGSYAGAQYQRQFTSQYSSQYQRQFTAQYTTQFARAQFARDTVGPQFAGPQYSAQYAGTQYSRTVEGQYQGQFARDVAGPTYAGTAYGRTYYGSYGGSRSGPQYFSAYSRLYYGNYAGNRPGPQYAGAAYSGTPTPGPQYSSQFQRWYWSATPRIGPQYLGSFARDYPAPAYSRQFARLYYAQYAGTRPGPSYSTGYTRTYFGSYAGARAGPSYALQYARQYTSQYSSQFTRITPGLQYNAQFTSPLYARQFTRQYTSQYGGQYTSQYARDVAGLQYEGQFARDVAGLQYARQFTGQYTRGFSGQYASQYTREVISNYSGDTINASYTTITKTLWLKVA